MSRKDYVAVAKLIAEQSQLNKSLTNNAQVRDTLHAVANGLADLFQADNALFNREKFLGACFSK